MLLRGFEYRLKSVAMALSNFLAAIVFEAMRIKAENIGLVKRKKQQAVWVGSPSKFDGTEVLVEEFSLE